MPSIHSFNISFDKASKKVFEQVNKSVSEGVGDLLGDIVRSTPVNTGQLRGNWQVSIGDPKLEPLHGESDFSGILTISRGQEQLKKFRLGSGLNSIIYIANNLEYAGRIEFGHHSKQAPYGMVRINTARFNKIMTHRIGR